MDAEPLHPPGQAPARARPRPVEWLLAVVPVDAAVAVAMGGLPLLLAASVLVAPPVLAVVRHQRLGAVPRRVPAVLLLWGVALATRLVVSEVFAGAGLL